MGTWPAAPAGRCESVVRVRGGCASDLCMSALLAAVALVSAVSGRPWVVVEASSSKISNVTALRAASCDCRGGTALGTQTSRCCLLMGHFHWMGRHWRSTAPLEIFCRIIATESDHHPTWAVRVRF